MMHNDAICNDFLEVGTAGKRLKEYTLKVRDRLLASKGEHLRCILFQRNFAYTIIDPSSFI